MINKVCSFSSTSSSEKMKRICERTIAGRACLAVALTIACLLSRPLLAQDFPFDENDRATIMLDIDVAAVNSTHADSDAQSLLANLGREFDIDMAKITRVRGAFRLPDDLETLVGYSPNRDVPQNFPGSFFSEYEFSEPSAMGEFFASKKFQTKIIDGREYHFAPEIPNLFLLADEKRFVVGTGNYLFKGDDDFLTDSLKAALKGIPETNMLRFAVDVEGTRILLNSIEENATNGVYVQSHAGAMLLSLLKNVDLLTVAASPDQELRLKLEAQSKDSDSATQFKIDLNQMLSTMKLGLLSVEPEIDRMAPEFNTMLNELFNSLDTVQKGRTVALEGTAPAGFLVTLHSLVTAQQDIAQTEAARSLAITLGTACKQYKLHVGRFPGSLDDLVNLPEGVTVDQWKGPYLDPDTVPENGVLDPWGNEYRLEADETIGRVTIGSAGPDGEFDTADDVSPATNRTVPRRGIQR